MSLPVMTSYPKTAISYLSTPLTLPCGLTLPNRLVKCPMQETLAVPPLFDPPIEKFENLYSQWAAAKYGLLITGQVQVDLRFLSIAGDVVCHEHAMEEEHLAKWKRWAEIAQSGGTPCIVQLAHPGRMSPAGAGVRPAGMQTLCPSSVPVKVGESWLDKLALEKLLGTPRPMTLSDIDSTIADFVRGALVAEAAGFAGCQLHGAHGFLISQFLSPYTNRRTDDYGGTPEKRMLFLQRLMHEVRKQCPPPFCVSVKLNSADYMAQGGLGQEEALEQVRWLVECGEVDFVEVSGGNAEQTTSGLHNSFGKRTISKGAPLRASTRIRESFFSDFAEKLASLNSPIPIQLSGGFRSRTGMADALASNTCDLIGLGRAAVLQPDLPAAILLNPDYDDEGALAMSHIVRGQWFSNWFPVKAVGSGLTIEFFYWNMRRLGNGLSSQPDTSIPWVVLEGIWESLRAGLGKGVQRMLAGWGGGSVKVE